MLRIHKGEAAPEDVAALLTLFTAMTSSNTEEASQDSLHSWNSKERMFRHFPTPGPGAWKASGLAQ